MLCTRKSVVALVLLCCSPAVTSAAPPPGVYTAEPSFYVRAFLLRLKERDRPREAMNALASWDNAAPYLRSSLAAATDKGYKRDLSETLDAIERRAFERNRARYAWWAQTGRVDLCAELLIDCRDDNAALKMADLLIPLRKQIVTEVKRAAGPSVTTSIVWGPEFQLAVSPIHFAGDHVTVPAAVGYQCLIRVDQCTVETFEKHCWFVAVRSELTDPPKGNLGSGKWFRSVVVVNSPTSLGRAEESLIVCDGDITIVPGVQHSVIIANGDIRSDAGSGGSLSYLCATGNINLPARKGVGDSRFHAGGSITFADKPGPSGQVKAQQKSLPFGIRFLDSKDFGLELAAQNGGVQVMDIAPESPFAKFGVQDADVITKIDDVDATTIPAFRRALRRGVIRESVVLRIRRDGKDITRIVFLDGIPVPAAPMPREVRR